MDGSSKILTVSYGTFSCTLEGFDDPLGTMRDLAEYFRDLAADDRYFGAEPPTPDVEMLQSIAQRDIHRKVEARTNPTGIALTQTPDAITPAVQEPPVAAKAAPEEPEEKTLSEEPPQESEPVVHDTGPLAFDDDFLMDDEPEDILAIDPDAAPSVDGPAESVAEKLRRIRAVVSRRPSEDNTPFPEQSSPEGKRNRAMTRTIDQIQYDLSDDEDASDDVAEVQAFEISSEDKPLPKAEDIASPSELSVEDVSALDESGDDNNDAYEEDEADSEPLDMSQFLENVSEKIGEANASPPANEAPTLDDASDADVGRLLEETDSKLNEDGIVRRRQVISQMRAAVAATKAERAVTRLISPEAQDEAHKKAYRNDLSDAVSQTRQLPTTRSARKPSGPPLVLVSSQRVAEETAQGEDSVEVQQPRTAASSDGFAEFVQSNDAQGLDELLEAAAAYTIFAKGQESFSRPEIMKRVAMVDPSLSLSREDGLRSFGQLLRQGKFQKLDRGQFTIDQDTRFNPENRIAGE